MKKVWNERMDETMGLVKTVRQNDEVLIEKKRKFFSCFRDLKNHVKRETRRKIKCLRSDGGKEYFSGQFTSYLQTKGIQREFSCRYTTGQNGMAEHRNRTLVEAARAMLEEKSMPKFYWV